MATPKQIKHPGYEAHQTDARAAGTGRRAYVRYPVALDATIVVSSDRSIPCSMRNFCMGGMFLHYNLQFAGEQPISIAANEVLTVHCLVPDAGGEKLIEFQARVARALQDGIGIAFINPNQESLQVMQRFALQFSMDAEKKQADKVSEIKGGGNSSGGIGRRYDDIIVDCERIVQETMDSLLGQLRAELANRLFDLSRDAASPEVQNEFFSASEVIKTNDTQFLNAVRSNFKERLQERVSGVLNHEQPRANKHEDISLEKLSLIGDEDLGAWLAVSEVTNKAEEKNRESLSTLNERLSVVYGMHINHVNNPYGPALFAESFQAALGHYEFIEPINVACYALLKEILVPLSTDLYLKLNSMLIEYGILPKLKFKLIGQSISSNSKREESNTAQLSDSTRPGYDQVSAPEAGTAQHDAAPPTEGSAGLHKPASTSRNEVGTRQAPPPQDSPSDLYQLIQNLRDLRRDLSSARASAPLETHDGSSGAMVSAGTQQRSPESAACYSTSELVNAVADLQINPQLYAGGDQQVDQIKSRLLEALKARNHEEAGKDINPHDDNVLEVTGDLLRAMQDDPLVAGSVKPWLKQLELPVLKLALQDPTLFFDQTHVARQVVNSIAQLEFYQQGDANSSLNSINAAVEDLLGKIAGERSNGVEIFSEIQSKLNNLIKIQDMAYAENIKDVVQACREHFPIPEVYELEALAGGNISEAEMRKWVIFARRLREGDDVLFSLLDSKPQRLRVAWIDEEQTLYVFVNLRGIKEKVMTVSDVARMMRLGIIEPQGNAADPAMDRAQYSIMQNLYKQVVYENTHDSLTGLINRREFSRCVDEAVMNARRDDKRHALLDIDVDQFSAINGSCGYSGGDKLLQDVVDILGKAMNNNGEIARLGGDQFGILLTDCSLDDALAIAEQLIEDVANYKLDWEGKLYSVSLSIGIVPISARSGSVDELMQASETSRNMAKETGGNRLQVFHAGHSRVGYQAELKKLAANVDKIIQEDGLEIRCQRIEPLDSSGVLRPHYEILLGVRDEQGNVGSPVEFIKGAELSRKMSMVDRHVITRTLAWMNDNVEIIDQIAGFTINLSGESLNEEGFVDFILEQLQDVRVPYEKICFEVTETVGITNLSDATLGIDRIKDTGCRFALDDFGSGMSSYGYLKNLPVDVVKIDGAFVKDLVADSSDYAVVKSITEIAHFMKKKVVAEFVETKEILDLLREIGVDYVQGYMIDKPGSLDRLANAGPVYSVQP
jgi:diguanylate cyclase (GGDEF)-like protein